MLQNSRALGGLKPAQVFLGIEFVLGYRNVWRQRAANGRFAWQIGVETVGGRVELGVERGQRAQVLVHAHGQLGVGCLCGEHHIARLVQQGRLLTLHRRNRGARLGADQACEIRQPAQSNDLVAGDRPQPVHHTVRNRQIDFRFGVEAVDIRRQQTVLLRARKESGVRSFGPVKKRGRGRHGQSRRHSTERVGLGRRPWGNLQGRTGWNISRRGHRPAQLCQAVGRRLSRAPGSTTACR